jgi:hypothetical protein
MLSNRLLQPGQVPGYDPRVQMPMTTDKDAVMRPVARYIQAFEDVQYPWNPVVVEALRKFDPRIVPLCTVSVYRTPAGSIHKFVRHVIALEQNPLEMREPVMANLLAPTAPTAINYGRHPNVWLKGWAGPQPSDTVLPGDYWPFDWEVEAFLRARFHTYDANAAKVSKSWKDTEDAVKASALAKMDAEIDYRLDHDKNHLRKAAQAVDPQLKKRGILRDTTPNPMVHMGFGPRP